MKAVQKKRLHFEHMPLFTRRSKQTTCDTPHVLGEPWGNKSNNKSQENCFSLLSQPPYVSSLKLFVWWAGYYTTSGSDVGGRQYSCNLLRLCATLQYLPSQKGLIVQNSCDAEWQTPPLRRPQSTTIIDALEGKFSLSLTGSQALTLLAYWLRTKVHLKSGTMRMTRKCLTVKIF